MTRSWWPTISALTAVAGAAVLAVVTAPAASAAPIPGTESAMVPFEQNNPVSGYTHSDASWTNYGTVRHHTTPGDMIFTPNNLPSGGMCMRLIESGGSHPGQVFAGPVCWTDHSSKAVATNVVAGTAFTISVHKISASGSDTYWAGTFYY